MLGMGESAIYSPSYEDFGKWLSFDVVSSTYRLSYCCHTNEDTGDEHTR